MLQLDDTLPLAIAGAIVEKQLIERGHLAYRMDGDNLRHGLNRVLLIPNWHLQNLQTD